MGKFKENETISAVDKDLKKRLNAAKTAAKKKDYAGALRQCEKMLLVLQGLNNPSKKSISALIEKDKPLNRNFFRTSNTKKLLNKIKEAQKGDPLSTFNALKSQGLTQAIGELYLTLPLSSSTSLQGEKKVSSSSNVLAADLLESKAYGRLKSRQDQLQNVGYRLTKEDGEHLLKSAQTFSPLLKSTTDLKGSMLKEATTRLEQINQQIKSDAPPPCYQSTSRQPRGKVYGKQSGGTSGRDQEMTTTPSTSADADDSNPDTDRSSGPRR